MAGLPRGATIGIIGGGQLGRMLAMAAGRLGFETVILEPQPDCPAAQMANLQIEAAYSDTDALGRLANACDVVTFEFENVDADALHALSDRVPVHPPAHALRVAQDRLDEKRFLRKAGLATADFHAVDTTDDLTAALAAFGGRGILKTRRMGYDGKGQVRFDGRPGDATPQAARDAIGGVPAILEAMVDFDCEISVIATRAADGATHCFEPPRNVHTDGILARSTVPNGLEPTVSERARDQARALCERLVYVGTLGLEFFVLADGGLLANEFAPRVHNSGHWTEAACTASQFEQHVRAIAGWPLADAQRHSDCVMDNVIGDDIARLPALATEPGVMVHDYGKAAPRPGRKMGHATRLTPRRQPAAD